MNHKEPDHINKSGESCLFRRLSGR
jgi:hypothetical protein